MFDYVVSVRLTEARRLLRETDFDDDMVAIKSGYDDGRHFRSVFKQYEGISTSEYRSKYGLYSNQAKQTDKISDGGKHEFK
jgi:transcriptional regulator GlxA family with amidase domain